MPRERDEYESHRPVRSQERDLVVAPNEFAYVSDQTKGNINVHVGPLKTSLAGTDQLVLFSNEQKKFMNSDIHNAIQTFATAPEGWYIVLKNPAVDGQQPTSGKAENLRDLQVGRKINIPGPESFALWPGQMTKVLKGHILRSNQYLVVRVYDEQSAQENWSKTVIKKAKTDGEETPPDDKEDSIESVTTVTETDITMGKLFIIKGTEVSFYIPPTGVEVVAEGNNYIRDAVTLERLEYCILKDENGEKRYVKGPDVVFPKPTEVFLKKSGTRKFKAIELSPITGLYIKVIAAYDDYNVGDELFITGKDQMIYFPREEHAIMKYGSKEKHYATAIPAGEARYVLNRLTGDIRLERGPSMFLPNPIEEVLVKRVLSIRDVERWFPGNQEAISYNMMLEQAKAIDSDGYVTEDSLGGSGERGVAAAYATSRVYEEDNWNAEQAVSAKMADVIQRGSTYTKPRTITIDSKYEGAVVIDVWTGYAVKVKSKTKPPVVVAGPKTIMLEYDETLEYMSLSTGTPKHDNEMLDTAYLRVMNNKISDVIYANTKDNCEVALSLSYRVNFEGDLAKAFDVENYVKFLTDHMRSLGKAIIKDVGIEDFYSNPHGIIRDAFLGFKGEDGQREGRFFNENEMRIYEVEILAVKIGDDRIEDMLIQNQNNIVKQSLLLTDLKRQTEYEKAQQGLLIEKENAKLQTTLSRIENEKKKVESQLALDLNVKNNEQQVAEMEKAVTEIVEAVRDISEDAARNRAQKDTDEDLRKAAETMKLKLEHIAAEVKAVQEKGKAVSPQLIAALQSLGDKHLASALSENMSLWGHLGGESVVDVFRKLFAGTKLEKIGDLLNENIE